MTISGRVIEEQKNYFVVDLPSSSAIVATTSGALKQHRKKPCCGDMVDLIITDRTGNRGIITGIHHRTSHIKRPALANCTCLFCLSTFREPPLNLEVLDRLLVYALIHDVEPCIVVNKSDTHCAVDNDDVEKILQVYSAIGHRVFVTSALTGDGIDHLVNHCTGKLSAFAGLSGVGKSTLLSAIFPEIPFRIGELSCSATRGMHTTTNVTLLPLGGDGYIADTPGLAYIDLPRIPEEDMVLCFNEIARCVGKCRFNNCTHENEPGCRVLEEVAEGSIASWRHEHYLKFRGEMIAKRKKYR